MITNLILIILITLAALVAVLKGGLIKAAIALAVTSMLLSVLMFRLDSPIAAVFELSVCAGLITVIFMSTISLTKPLTREETVESARVRSKRFWLLPVLMAIAGGILMLVSIPFEANLTPPPAGAADVRDVLWNFRQLDLLGQILVLLAGVFGIVVLFKDKPGSDSNI